MSFFNSVPSANSGGSNVPRGNYGNQPDALVVDVDNSTIEVSDGRLIVKNIDGLIISSSELNEYLRGTSSNIQIQIGALRNNISALSKGMKWKGEKATYALLSSLSDNEDGDTYVVPVDETHSNTRSIYVYNEENWNYVGQFDFVPEATLENRGIVQLSDDKRSTSTETVPTSKVISDLYDDTTSAFSGLAEYVLGRTVDANTERKGIVKMSSDYESDSEETVATSKAVSDLYNVFYSSYMALVNHVNEHVEEGIASPDTLGHVMVDDDTIKISEDGVISATLPNVTVSDASTTTKGIVQLEDGYESESTETVPTSRAVNEMFNALVATVMGLAEYLNETVADATTENKGVVQLIDSYESDSVELAPTAKALNDLKEANAESNLFTYNLLNYHANAKTTAEDYGHVKVDGTTITVNDGVISAVGTSDSTVKINSEDEAGYLQNKIDNVTIKAIDGKLKVSTIDGLTIGVVDINNLLSGTNGNIQNQINTINNTLLSLTSGMEYIGKFETFSSLNSINNKENGYLAVVLSDENKNNGRSMYVYSESLGMWEFVGAFTFTDDFVSLKDTPSSYNGANGKVLKVDEVNEKLVFSDIEYNELTNKPSSTITQIDDAVDKKHNHPNLALLNTYNKTNVELTTAVNQTHSHSNKTGLDKLDVNANGELLINGTIYAPKKQLLYARRGSTDQELNVGDTCIFNTNIRGDIPYNSTTGEFTLTAGKVYRVTVTASMNTEGYVILRLVDTNNTQPHSNSAIWTDVTKNWHEASAGNLEVVLSPASTKNFKIQATSINGTSSLRSAYSAIIIQEL